MCKLCAELHCHQIQLLKPYLPEPQCNYIVTIFGDRARRPVWLALIQFD